MVYKHNYQTLQRMVGWGTAKGIIKPGQYEKSTPKEKNFITAEIESRVVQERILKEINPELNLAQQYIYDHTDIRYTGDTGDIYAIEGKIRSGNAYDEPAISYKKWAEHLAQKNDELNNGISNINHMYLTVFTDRWYLFNMTTAPSRIGVWEHNKDSQGSTEHRAELAVYFNPENAVLSGDTPTFTTTTTNG